MPFPPSSTADETKPTQLTSPRYMYHRVHIPFRTPRSIFYSHPGLPRILPQTEMPIFPSKKFTPSRSAHRPDDGFGSASGVWYRANLARRPFLLFGLPFVAVIVAGSFLLTPATALRYERHDRKVQALNEAEALGLGVSANKDGQDAASPSEDGSGLRKKNYNPRARTVGSDKDEYYVRFLHLSILVLLFR